MRFDEQIKKGNIEIIDSDVLTIPNYCNGYEMTFKKARNRNGQIIERTSIKNGKQSKPKKTTASRLNIFVYDKELQKHFIVSVDGHRFTLYTTNFYNANRDYEEYYFAPVSKEYQETSKSERDGYETLLLFFGFDLLKMTEEVFKKLYEYNGGR